MNFFPNLQIIFNISPVVVHQEEEAVEQEATGPMGTTGQTGPTEITGQTGPMGTTVGLSVQQAHDSTSLFVMSSLVHPVVCVICQNACEAGTIVQMVQRCGHIFHPVCILRWLMQNGTCPVCRIQLG